jgi:Ca2+-binding EF-hand superfamily protein
VLFASLAVLAAAAVGRAQQATPAAQDDDGGPTAFADEFDRADTDKDGRLSEEEAKKAGFFTTEQSFKGTDADGDGVVTLFELGDALQKRLRQWNSESARADTDGDGYVSREEAESAGGSLSEIFVRADRDRDGRVGRDEFDLYARGAFYSETADPGVVPNIINKRF